MTRWLQAARREDDPRTKPTEPTELGKPPAKEGAEASGKVVLSVSSVLSERGTLTPEALDRKDDLEPDAGAYFDRLRTHGPATYGAIATAMGWGATRAWRAEAKLRALGLVRLGEFGRVHPNTDPTCQMISENPEG